LKIHPDKSCGNVDQLNEQFQLLSTAKRILTDIDQRRLYDQWRTSHIAVDFKQWLANKDVLKMVLLYIFGYILLLVNALGNY
jgi:curved DNA-binding protein CbpA